MSEKKRRIAFLIDWLSSPYQDWHAYEFRKICEEKNCLPVIFIMGRLNLPGSFEQDVNKVVRFITPDRFDGLIIAAGSISNRMTDRQYSDFLSAFEGIPFVNLSREIDPYPSVMIDNYSGMYRLTEHLVKDHNFKKLVFVAGPRGNNDSETRLDAFKCTLEKYKIEFAEKSVFYGNFLFEDGPAAVSYFFDELKCGPEVIVCANDSMASGITSELHSRGLMVPEDLAVTGFDDLPLNKFFMNSLTTVRLPFNKMMEEALDLILSGNESENGKHRIVLPDYVLRRSCGCETSSYVSYCEEKPELNEDITFSRFMENQLDISLFLKCDSALPLFLESLYKFIKNNKDEDCLKLWNRFLIKYINGSHSIPDIYLFFNRLTDLLSDYPPGNKKRNELLELIDTLRRFTEGHYPLWEQQYLQKKEREFLHYSYFTDRLYPYLMLSGQRNILSDVMKEYDFRFFVIMLYKDFDDPGKGSRVFFAYHDGKVLDDLYDRETASGSEMFPIDLENMTDCCILVNTLAIEKGSVGYLITDYTERDYRIYDTLRRSLSNALIAAVKSEQLAREIEEKERAEKAVTEALVQLESANRKLSDLSLRDDLTDLYNRRGFFMLAEQEYNYFSRKNLDFLLIFIDLDHLKKINDSYGHNEGDRAIKLVAEALTGSLRNSDIIARIGGDEFLAFIPDLDKDFRLLEKRINDYIRKINKRKSIPFHLDVSIGFSSWKSDNRPKLKKMIELADTRLYGAKKNKSRKS